MRDDPHWRGAGSGVHKRSHIAHGAVEGARRCRVGLDHRIAHPHQRKVAVENVPLHPDGSDVAEHEADRSAGLNQHAGRNQFLHHHAGDGRTHRQFGADGAALLLGLVDLLRGDAEDAQRLQAVLHVGKGVVVVRLGAFQVLNCDCPVVQQGSFAIHNSLVENFAIARFAVSRHGVHHIRAGDVEQRIARIHFCAGVHQNARDRAVDLGNGLRGMVGVPIHRAGGVDGDLPVAAFHRYHFEVRHLVRRYGKQRGLDRLRAGRGLALYFLQVPAGTLQNGECQQAAAKTAMQARQLGRHRPLSS